MRSAQRALHHRLIVYWRPCRVKGAVSSISSLALVEARTLQVELSVLQKLLGKKYEMHGCSLTSSCSSIQHKADDIHTVILPSLRFQPAVSVEDTVLTGSPFIKHTTVWQDLFGPLISQCDRRLYAVTNPA